MDAILRIQQCWTAQKSHISALFHISVKISIEQANNKTNEKNVFHISLTELDSRFFLDALLMLRFSNIPFG